MEPFVRGLRSVISRTELTRICEKAKVRPTDVTEAIRNGVQEAMKDLLADPDIISIYDQALQKQPDVPRLVRDAITDIIAESPLLNIYHNFTPDQNPEPEEKPRTALGIPYTGY